MSDPFEDYAPADYAVFIEVPSRRYRNRMGNYHTVEEATNAIARNEASRGETFGGLLEPSRDRAFYTIWKAERWTLVKRL